MYTYFICNRYPIGQGGSHKVQQVLDNQAKLKPKSCISNYDLHTFYLNIVDIFFFFFWSCMKQRIIKTIKAVRSFQVNILLALISYTMEFRIISACYDFCVEPRGFWSVLLLCSSSLCHDQILHIFHKVKPICCRTCFCL